MITKRASRRSRARLRYLVRQLPTGKDRATWVRSVFLTVLLVSAAVVIDIVFPGRSLPDLPRLEGVVADRDVIAPLTFPVHKTAADLNRERAMASQSVFPIYELRPEIADSARGSAQAFFEALDRGLSGVEDEGERNAIVREIIRVYRVPASENQIHLLASQDSRRRLRAALDGAYRNFLRPGIVKDADLGGAETRAINLRVGGDERVVLRDSVATMQEYYRMAASRGPAEIGVGALDLYQNLVIRFSDATIRYNSEATDSARARAMLAVDSIKYVVLEGERIVAAHERVGPEALERLRALESQLARTEGGRAWQEHVGGILYSLLLLGVLGLILKYFRPALFESNRSLTLVWFLLLVVAGTAGLITRTEVPPELIPVAFAALVLAILFDGVLALITVFVLVALLAAQQPTLSTSVLFSAVIGGSAAALSGRLMRRRAHVWRFALVIAAAYVAAGVSLALVSRLNLLWLAQSSFWGSVNAIGCSVLAAGVLPLAESFTRITTDQTLLELADLNRPLLRRLSLEAPGTYAHSINVANLAEAAAHEIGANSLLVRVGVYYHDIGKVNKPQYFVENQPPGRNPHDKLKPVTSANIVREHVVDGLELVEKERLPGVVRAFITEHHGTQRIGFFWERAKELDPETEPKDSDFRYRGPKPQSKETAIVLLADSIESAARVLQDPTPERITELVDRIVDHKIREQQLDDAPLTLQEISVIKSQFVKVLTSMYHHRLDYPLQNQQPARGEEAVAREAS